MNYKEWLANISYKGKKTFLNLGNTWKEIINSISDVDFMTVKNSQTFSVFCTSIILLLSSCDGDKKPKTWLEKEIIVAHEKYEAQKSLNEAWSTSYKDIENQIESVMNNQSLTDDEKNGQIKKLENRKMEILTTRSWEAMSVNYSTYLLQSQEFVQSLQGEIPSEVVVNVRKNWWKFSSIQEYDDYMSIYNKELYNITELKNLYDNFPTITAQSWMDDETRNQFVLVMQNLKKIVYDKVDNINPFLKNDDNYRYFSVYGIEVFDKDYYWNLVLNTVKLTEAIKTEMWTRESDIVPIGYTTTLWIE